MVKIEKFIGANAGGVTQGNQILPRPFSQQPNLPPTQPRPQNGARVEVRFDRPSSSTKKR